MLFWSAPAVLVFSRVLSWPTNLGFARGLYPRSARLEQACQPQARGMPTLIYLEWGVADFASIRPASRSRGSHNSPRWAEI